MAVNKITQPKDPYANSRRRTTKGRAKYEAMVDRNGSKRNSTTSWNRSVTPATVYKKPSSTKKINKR